MFEFFDFISNLISSVVGFFTGMIENVVAMFNMIASGIVFLTASIAYLPPFCKGAIEVIIAVSICSVVLGSFVDFK